MRVLITGGAGYIGSHTVKHLIDTGMEPIVYDNLSTGHASAVPSGQLIRGDLSDAPLLKSVLRDYRVEAVIHFAALTSVGESMIVPAKYFHNNLVNSLTLLECMRESGVRTIVFSSTAAVYGSPMVEAIPETHPAHPTSVYGETKLSVENALHWYGQLHQFRWAALRYFNAAGADPDGGLGERHSPETHLIPLAIQAALRHRGPLDIFGIDYRTPDGTAIRDYVHVSDLAIAHRAALDYLLAGGGNLICNLGTGRGYSVREVIRAVEWVTRLHVPIQLAERRMGDPAILVAKADLAKEVLGWSPCFSDLDTIVQTAFRWEHRLAKTECSDFAHC